MPTRDTRSSKPTPIPFPYGERPEMRPAWEVLASGGTFGAAADAAGVSSLGTISKWLRRWRSNYGDDLFRTARAEQTRHARAEAILRWQDIRMTHGSAGVQPKRIDHKVRARVLALGRCVWCHDVTGPFEIDHVVPTVLGGTNDEDNLVPSCRDCNSKKFAKPPGVWLKEIASAQARRTA